MNSKDYNFLSNFIDEKVEKVSKKGISEITDFLDPSESGYCEDILKKYKNKISYLFFGGNSESERKRLLIASKDAKNSSADFQMVVIEAITNKPSKEITHRDVLGALMSTGIKREKTGDIFLISNGAAIVVDRNMTHYLTGNFPMIKKSSFVVEVFEVEDYKFPESIFTEKTVNVSSWRLDGFLAKTYNLSRGDAQEFIKSGKVKVNHRENEKMDFQLKPEDIVSVRTRGRFVIKEDLGKTKKDNIRVLINIY